MIKKIFILLVFVFLFVSLEAQITVSPQKALSSGEIEIVFDAGKGNKALFGEDGNVYFHIGLITSNSTSNKDWKFVRGNWGKADADFRMEKLGGDKYRLKLNPISFFQIDSEVDVYQIAIVFRDAKGEKVAKTKAETDFLIPLNGFKPKIKNPNKLKYTSRSYIGFEVNDTSLILNTSQGSYRFEFYNSTVLKVAFSGRSIKKPFMSPSVVVQPQNLKHKLIENKESIEYLVDDFQIVITKEPLRISYHFKGKLLLKESLGFFERLESTGVRFELSEKEAIYGTGERAVPLNRRGYRFDLYNRPDYNYQLNAKNLNYTLPIVLSSEKYMVFYDNYQKGYIDIDKSEDCIMEFGSIGGQQQYYIIAGHSFEEISASFSNLVGLQPLPPRWALGNLQSRMAYRTQKEVEGIVDEMIEKDFPLDAIIIDFYWFGDSIKGYLGNLQWYEKNWPQPEKMIKDFKRKGVKTILITEPFIIDTSYWYVHTDTAKLLATHGSGESYIMNDFYFGKAGLLDMFKPETKDWFWEQYQKQIEIGVAGWWGDLGEPETHPADMYHVNGKAEEVHNKYAHEWAAMLYNKYQEHYPNTRLFHLNRSGATGTQRYSIFSWSGDVSRSWSGFQAQLPLMLNMSLCGLAYSSSDLGGFALGEKDEELYIRWLQMGVFNPVFRPHGSGIPSEPIFFSQKTQDIVREAIKLRYRLMPYIYNAAYENTVLGKPIVKPLFYYHDDDDNLQNYSDAYYFGDEIIVAPVINKGIKEKEVYLPKGWWYDFKTSELIKGEQKINIDVSLNEIPFFIKAGSFIPMVNNYQTTDRYPKEELIIHYYPSIDSQETEYILFEDDGLDAMNIENDNYQIIKFTGKQESGFINLFLLVDSRQYTDNKNNRRLKWVIHHVDQLPQMVMVNSKEVKLFDIEKADERKKGLTTYDASKKQLIIKMPFNKTKINIQIKKN